MEVSSVLTFICYLQLIGGIGASRADYSTVVFSIFALLLFTGFESFSWIIPGVIGLGFVLIGNLIMNRARCANQIFVNIYLSDQHGNKADQGTGCQSIAKPHIPVWNQAIIGSPSVYRPGKAK